jgi:aspartate aminotransferase-like enzyme
LRPGQQFTARQTGNDSRATFAPAPIADVVAAIRDAKPNVFAPHVETSAGILPDDYVTALAAAAHEVGALMVLDCIASGCALG